MKTAIFVIAIFLSGCATTGVQPLTAEQGAAALRVAVSTPVTLVLNNNPAQTTAVMALATGVEAAVVSSTVITPELIGTFVVSICRQHGVPQKDIAIYVNVAQSIYAAYVTAYRPAVVSGVDPRVVLYARAFADGLRDAVGAVSIANQSQPSP